ncbi:MAG: MmgE/PrpD family protein [Proteobacteria bacterium]|nr:MmgE/PrpD family protein [Pseudomonadota bacterium]
MSPADGMKPRFVADRIGAWVADFQLSQASPQVIAAAKHCLIDVIGVTLAGSRHPTAQIARSYAEAQYRGGPCSVLGGQRTLAAPGAAFANGVAAHALDFDDVSHEAMVHGSAAVWPAVAAATEASGASGEVLLTAFIAGVEAEYALGRALTHDLFWRGWWTTGLLGSIGAAAGAAKAMTLDRAATANAVGLAACQATGPWVVVGTPAKPHACGRAAEGGLEAALLAASGLTAPPDAFENEKGFIKMFSNGIFEPAELDRLGDRYVLETSGVAFKLFPVCSGAQAATEATLDILSEESLSGGDVKSVHCEVTRDSWEYLKFPDPKTVTQAQFSMPFAVGCALAFGKLGVAQISEKTLHDPRLRIAMKKVAMARSETLNASSAQYPEAAAVTIQTKDGREFRKLNVVSTGGPGKPMTQEQVDRKFHACADGVLARADAERVLEGIKRLESLKRAAALFGPPN